LSKNKISLFAVPGSSKKPPGISGGLNISSDGACKLGDGASDDKPGGGLL